MIRRCTSPTDSDFARYGCLGVRVCDRWRHGEGGLTGYQCFVADMGPKPIPKHSLDRIDNDGDYAPENCRWATTTQQAANKREGASSQWRNAAGVRVPLAARCLLDRLTPL
jgi:hypothetical protein